MCTSFLTSDLHLIVLTARLRLKRDGTRKETRFHLLPKRTNPFKSAGASVQSTNGSRVVRVSGSNARYTTVRDSVKSTGYPLNSPVSPSLPLPCVTMCHQVSNALYHILTNLHWSYYSNLQHSHGYHHAFTIIDNNTKTHKKYTSYDCSLNFIVQTAIYQIFLGIKTAFTIYWTKWR